MKTDLHHGLNLAAISYRLLEWMASLGSLGLQDAAAAQSEEEAASRLQFNNQVSVDFYVDCTL